MIHTHQAGAELPVAAGTDLVLGVAGWIVGGRRGLAGAHAQRVAKLGKQLVADGAFVFGHAHIVPGVGRGASCGVIIER